MKFKKKLMTFGNSNGVIIDKVISKSLDIQKGDDVWITLKKIKKGNI